MPRTKSGIKVKRVNSLARELRREIENRFGYEFYIQVVSAVRDPETNTVVFYIAMAPSYVGNPFTHIEGIRAWDRFYMEILVSPYIEDGKVKGWYVDSIVTNHATLHGDHYMNMVISTILTLALEKTARFLQG